LVLDLESLAFALTDLHVRTTSAAQAMLTNGGNCEETPAACM